MCSLEILVFLFTHVTFDLMYYFYYFFFTSSGLFQAFLIFPSFSVFFSLLWDLIGGHVFAVLQKIQP